MTDVLSLFLKLILLMIFAKLVQTATFKGWVGEFFVKLQLKETKKEHVKKIKEYKAENKSSLSICPRCNSELKNRKGKNGDFIGCSSYPKCRYTKSL